MQMKGFCHREFSIHVFLCPWALRTQCSLIRRAPFFADDMGHKREVWKLITEVLLMRGYLPCVAREQYENSRGNL